jgi:hypothetical protein
MQPQTREPARGYDECEVQVGPSSWDSDEIAVKFAWKNINGHWARGGEVPVAALPQMLEVAIRDGYLSLAGEQR